MKTAPLLLGLLVLPLFAGCGSGASTNAGTSSETTNAPAVNESPIANEATMANVPGSATNAATNGGAPVPTRAEMEKQIAEAEKTYDAEIAKVTNPEQRAKLEEAKASAMKALRAAMNASGVK